MDTAEAATGKWHGILPQLGVDTRFLSGRHGPCPMCGGRDRWRFDNKEGRGTWFCTRCGAGDGFRLIMVMRGLPLDNTSFMAVAREIDKVVGNVSDTKTPYKWDVKKQESRMADIWRDSTALKHGDPVMLYLASRGITIAAHELHDARSLKDGMVSLYRNSIGSVVQMQIMDLQTRDRKFIGGLEFEPGAVRLMNHMGRLGIGEGIETCLSASQLFDIPCWAALNAAQLAKWEPPANVKEVVIFGDNDENFVGQTAAYHLAKRLAAKDGVDYVSVYIPAMPGDWNDELRSRVKNIPPARDVRTG